MTARLQRQPGPGRPGLGGGTGGSGGGASGGAGAIRSTALRLARLHLRGGSFALARAELESLAGSGALDDPGLLDLAEIRWRTGDLPGAGDAANAYLAAGGQELLGLVIAAEANATLGRPAEARRLVGQVLERADGPLDPLFAGMPRSAIWPHAVEVAGEPAGVLFPAERAHEAPLAPTVPVVPPLPPLPGAPPDVPSPVPAGWGVPQPAAATRSPVVEPGLWDGQPELAAVPAPDGRAEMEAGRGALERGDHATAALHLAVALRLDPGGAAAVLQAIGEAPGPGLALVRGDALRILGQEWDARRAYASVAARLRERADAGDRPSASHPAPPVASAVPTQPDTGSPPPKEEP
ncbi:MAG TPA: hypothetical protein VF763_06085 [Candidatus Limnocylindrales bacterium]